MGLLLAFFYNVVVSWSLWYLTVSVASLVLPGYRLEWAYCDHDYNTACCSNDSSSGSCGNATVSSVEEYWERNILAHQGYDWANFVSASNIDTS